MAFQSKAKNDAQETVPLEEIMIKQEIEDPLEPKEKVVIVPLNDTKLQNFKIHPQNSVKIHPVKDASVTNVKIFPQNSEMIEKKKRPNNERVTGAIVLHSTQQLEKTDFCEPPKKIVKMSIESMMKKYNISSYKCQLCHRQFVHENQKNKHQKHCKGNPKKLTIADLKKIYAQADSNQVNPEEAMKNDEVHPSENVLIENPAEEKLNFDTPGIIQNEFSEIVKNPTIENLQAVKVENLENDPLESPVIKIEPLDPIDNDQIDQFESVGIDTFEETPFEVVKETEKSIQHPLKPPKKIVVTRDEIDLIRCRFCPYTFKNLEDKNEHEKIHPKEKCRFCVKTFETDGKRRYHETVHHGKEPFQCDICPSNFKYLQTFLKHKKSHEEHEELVKSGKILPDSKLFPCYFCELSYLHKKSRDLHEIAIHLNKSSFKCEFCDKTFNYQNGLSAHIERIHKKVKNYPCNVCEKSFATKPELTNHTRKHTGEKPFSCDLCPSKFATKNAKTAHELGCKNQDLKWECQFCHKEYKHRNKRDNHVRVHHTKEKKFLCRFCDKKFSTRKAKKIHEAKNHEEKPFKCQFCENTFGSEKSRDFHELSQHINKGAFKCEICQKTFNYEANLLVHMQRMHKNGKTKKQKIEDIKNIDKESVETVEDSSEIVQEG